jgi:hypothetical protein
MLLFIIEEGQLTSLKIGCKMLLLTISIYLLLYVNVLSNKECVNR